MKDFFQLFMLVSSPQTKRFRLKNKNERKEEEKRRKEIIVDLF
jgi:hypothetical protein